MSQSCIQDSTELNPAGNRLRDSRRRGHLRLFCYFMAAFGICLRLTGEAFPIDRFKNFINTKPTIEAFDFKVLTRKFQDQDFPTNTYRTLNLVYENDTTYRLIEDLHNIVYGPVTVRSLSGTQETVPSYRPPITLDCLSRFGETLWSTFNPDGVLTGKVEASNSNEGWVRLAKFRIGIAYDALNLGIIDLKTNGVTWNGAKFECTNDNGASIEGELFVSGDSTPLRLVYNLARNGRNYSYEVSYGFTPLNNLPDFFPSRIKIETVKNESRRLMSEYRVLGLRLSDRKLTLEDVAFVRNPITNLSTAIFTNRNKQVVVVPPGTNLVQYTFSNGSLHRIEGIAGSNRLVRIRSASEAASSGPLWRRGIGWIALVLFLTAAPLFIVYFAKQRPTKTERGKD